MILVDSSFYISLVIKSDLNHLRAQALASKVKQRKSTTEDFVKETLTVVSQRKGKFGSIHFYETLCQDTTIIPVTSDRFQMGLKIFLDPKTQKDISVVDCIAAAIYREIGVSAILTFDPHFRSLGLKVIN